jgi:hypothetical protein
MTPAKKPPGFVYSHAVASKAQATRHKARGKRQEARNRDVKSKTQKARAIRLERRGESHLREMRQHK